MSTLPIAVFVQRTIEDRRQHVLDVLENNGIQNMEQYANLMGELTALKLVQQELSGLLEKQEHIDDEF
jgi:hypothetical protein|tara:strand:+ start:239 stop:442 length:204 start_codon:yes stop_codon:yes gene_type:complete